MRDTRAIKPKLFDIADGYTEPYLSTAQLAKVLNVSPVSIRRWVSKKRDFPAYKIGGDNRYRVSEVVAFFNERKRK